jgi:hypothetical protein
VLRQFGKSSGKARLIIAICGFAAALFNNNKAVAQDADQLTMIVNSGICPGDLSTYSIVNGNERCNPDGRNTKQCDRQYSPGGRQWDACYQEVFKCYREVDEINKKIYAYNAFIYKCRTAFPERPRRQVSQPSHNRGGAASSAGLTRAVEAEKKKADEARRLAREAATKAEQKRTEEEAKKKRLKEAAIKVPSFCQGMIRACEERAASLANLTSATQSQCRAYCQILQIENCNPSSTVQQAAQACNAGAERDQRETTLRARERERERERYEREAAPRRTAPNREASAWRCFPDYNSCTAYCRQVTGASGNSGWCGGICSETGTGNRPKPREFGNQSCYHPQ